MNYLAHLYLTKDYPDEVAVGNFMADSVKGKKVLLDYPEQIRKGIEMHRTIDGFTDTHSLFRQGTKRLHPRYGKFASIIMDIYYDHILATCWADYSIDTLPIFAQSQYHIMTKYQQQLTEPALRWLTIMTRDSLLESYESEAGIDSVLKRMDKRTNGISGMGSAMDELRLHKKAYSEEFHVLFSELQTYLIERFG